MEAVRCLTKRRDRAAKSSKVKLIASSSQLQSFIRQGLSLRQRPPPFWSFKTLQLLTKPPIEVSSWDWIPRQQHTVFWFLKFPHCVTNKGISYHIIRKEDVRQSRSPEEMGWEFKHGCRERHAWTQGETRLTGRDGRTYGDGEGRCGSSKRGWGGGGN